MDVGESYMVGSPLVDRGNGRIPLHADRDAAGSEGWKVTCMKKRDRVYSIILQDSTSRINMTGHLQDNR